jgi:UDP-N-acetylmuramyl pentapeptide phosphotransferase/UDP-N-acetylglucosamine-1-phosphate transferase
MIGGAWMINLYNFMDGMNGFADGMTVIGATTLAALSLSAGQSAISANAALLAAATLGFLALNFPPARIFLGDVGSAPIGYAITVLALCADKAGAVPIWVSALIFSPFIVDASVTLMLRVIRAEKLSQAHKTHAYQRLVCSGWGHRKTVLCEFALMSACSTGAFFACLAGEMASWMTMAFAIVSYVALAGAVAKLTVPDKATAITASSNGMTTSEVMISAPDEMTGEAE